MLITILFYTGGERGRGDSRRSFSPESVCGAVALGQWLLCRLRTWSGDAPGPTGRGPQAAPRAPGLRGPAQHRPVEARAQAGEGSSSGRQRAAHQAQVPGDELRDGAELADAEETCSARARVLSALSQLPNSRLLS